MSLHLSAGAIGLKATPARILDYAAQFGFDSIDADAASVAALSPDEMSRKHVAWAIAGLPVDFRRDDAAFLAGMSDLPKYAATLRKAGASRVTTWISPASKDLTYVPNFRLHASRLREVAKVFGGEQIRFGMEYVGPKTLWARQRYPFIHTMREMRELIAEINQPNAGLVIDSWHWWHSRETANDILALKSSDIVSIDLNDAPAGVPIDEQLDNRRELPAATGVIDVKSFLNALRQIGFTGPVRAEPFNEAVRQMAPEAALTATMNSLKKAFTNLTA